jgi:hypothetical protein
VDGAKRRPHADFDAVKMPVPRRLSCPVFEMRPFSGMHRFLTLQQDSERAAYGCKIHD